MTGSRGLWVGTLLVFAAVDVGYVLLLGLSSPRAPEEALRPYLVESAILASPAALAGALVWVAWRWRLAVRFAGLDLPARLLATAVATLPADRRDWGVAMTAELAHVRRRRERWRFALGCTRAAVFPPRGHRALVAIVAALSVAVAAGSGLATARTLPELRVFAVTFAGLVGVLATVAVSRASRPRRPAPGLPIAAAGLAGVVAAVALTAYYLRTEATVVLDRHAAVTLAVALAAGLWLSLAPPRALTTSRRARRAGLAVGVATAAGLALNAHLNDIAAGQIIGLYLLTVPVTALFLTAFFVTLADRSFWAGLQAAVWALVATCLLGFGVYLVETFRYWRAGVHPIDGDGIYGAAGVQLHEAIGWMLTAVPALALPFAVFGAALGTLSTGPREAVVRFVPASESS
ncbi:hypothetical protein [Phytohabitans houttuyneae]|uniref:Uncharacterized protein n=1 Tax=Phytohabitans houttuyneae TaxID=1076126 RepID=A0A6V8KM75_9ACTN|nr:hypothetical protein [Phytohabitans houttuyneae]GFJ86253.1 hypothetical protein Phou_104330 [Phytohabitans houttuyneae]